MPDVSTPHGEDPERSRGRPDKALGARVVAGSAMLIGGNLAVRVIGILNIAILARLLAPQDYGLMALALVAVGFAQVLSELQIVNALIRLPEIEDAHFETAMTLTLLRGVVMGGALFGFSDWIAAAFDEPALAPVLRWLALLPIIEGALNPRLAEFARHLDFSREAVVVIAGKLVALLVATTVALLSADYWALVTGTLIGAGFATAASHAMAPHKIRITLRHWRMFVGFGGWLTMSGIVNFAGSKISTVLIGGRLGTETLGYYNLGDQMATMATSQLAAPFTKATYSGLAKVAQDPQRLQKAYIKAQTVILAIILPIGVGSGMAAREIVLVLAGPKWMAAIPVVQIVAPIIAVTIVVSGVQALFMVRGETRPLFLCNLVNFAIRVPVLALGITLGGLIGVLWARVVTGLIYLFSMLYLVTSVTGAGIASPLLAAWRSFAACAVMVCALVFLQTEAPAISLQFWPNLLLLAIKAAVGGVAYLGSHFAFWLLVGKPGGFEQTMIDTGASVIGHLFKRQKRKK